jgi:hypothetical protein
MNKEMDVALVFFVVFGGMLAAVYLLGRWVLGPIDRAAKARRAPVRFSIADFLCLFVAVQLPLTLVARMRSDDTEPYFWFFAILAWVVAPVIWIACAAALSRAAITKGSQRLIFMGLVLPVAYYGLIPFVVIAAMTVIMTCEGQSKEITKYPGTIFLWMLTGIAIFVCGLYTRRLVMYPVAEQLPLEFNDGDTASDTVAARDAFGGDHAGSTTPAAGRSSANGHVSHCGIERRQNSLPTRTNNA